MKLSVFYDHVEGAARQRELPLDNVLAQVRAFGITALEFSYHRIKEPELRKRIYDAGFSISSINCFFEWDKSTDTAKAFDLIDLAAEQKVKSILLIPGFLDESIAPQLHALASSYEKTAAWLESNPVTRQIRDVVQKVSAYAAQQNVIATLEDFDSVKSPFSRANQLRWFLNTIPELKFTLDTGNFAFCGDSVLDAFPLLKKDIVHVHCKDRGDKLSPAPVGGGSIPFPQLIALLKNEGYVDYLTIEHYNAPDHLDFMEKSAAFLSSLLTPPSN